MTKVRSAIAGVSAPYAAWYDRQPPSGLTCGAAMPRSGPLPVGRRGRGRLGAHALGVTGEHLPQRLDLGRVGRARVGRRAGRRLGESPRAGAPCRPANVSSSRKPASLSVSSRWSTTCPTRDVAAEPDQGLDHLRPLVLRR